MQHDTTLTAARIGKGKAVHHYYPGATRTSCAAGGMGDAPATIVDEAITCKTCLKSLAREVAHHHDVALTENAKRDQADRDASMIKLERGVRLNHRGAVIELLDRVPEIGTHTPGWTVKVHLGEDRPAMDGYVTERALIEGRATLFVREAKPVHVRHASTGLIYAVEGVEGGAVWLRGLVSDSRWEVDVALDVDYVATCAHGAVQGLCARAECAPTPFEPGDRVQSRVTGRIGYVVRVSGLSLLALPESADSDVREITGMVVEFQLHQLPVRLQVGDLVTKRRTGQAGVVAFIGGDWSARTLHVQVFGGGEIVDTEDAFEPRYRAFPTITGKWGVIGTANGAKGSRDWLMNADRNAVRFNTFADAHAAALSMFRRE